MVVARRLASPSSVNAAIKQIADVMRRANYAGALQYVPEISWILFLRILDERAVLEAEEAEAVGVSYTASLAAPYRWRDWAAPTGPKRLELTRGAMGSYLDFVNGDLLPYLHGLRDRPGASARQRVISQVVSAVDRVDVDTERNLLDILDRVHDIRQESVDQTHVFTLSQAYERLLLKMGEKNNDGGYGGLFAGAPDQYDVVLMNPPFGGKEGREAQTRFAYKTGATQVLFLQHVIDALKPGGRCGMVIDEGVLFRATETAFVQTKRKLLDDCDLWCIVSLPPGVFSSAGAGVKTNLLFFTKGGPTERIWYYDLSDVKVTKKQPLTLDRFDGFIDAMADRADTEHSWTVTREEVEARRFDLKAVNPNAKVEIDPRTPAELLDEIEARHVEVQAAIEELRRLL